MYGAVFPYKKLFSLWGGLITDAAENIAKLRFASLQAAQVDMVIDRADGIITICEIKYSKDDYALTKKEYENIVNRANTFAHERKTNKGVQAVLMTTYRLKQNEYSDIAQRVITMDDLFLEA